MVISFGINPVNGGSPASLNKRRIMVVCMANLYDTVFDICFVVIEFNIWNMENSGVISII